MWFLRLCHRKGRGCCLDSRHCDLPTMRREGSRTPKDVLNVLGRYSVPRCRGPVCVVDLVLIFRWCGFLKVLTMSPVDPALARLALWNESLALWAAVPAAKVARPHE